VESIEHDFIGNPRDVWLATISGILYGDEKKGVEERGIAVLTNKFLY
jgi:hypothetical protein